MNKQQLAHLETRIVNTERYAKAALPQPTRDRWGDEVDVFDEAPEHVRNAVAIKKEAERTIERWRKARKVQYEKAIAWSALLGVSAPEKGENDV